MMEIISRRLLSIVVVIAVLAAGSVAFARPRAGGGSRPFEANKTFGLGLMIGAPTGLSGKYFLSSDRALDFGVGAIYGYRYGNGFHVHGDYLWHPVSLAHTEAFELPFYLGVGARIWSFGCGNCTNNATAIGVRVPFGLSMDFNEAPIDIFFELVVVADVFVNYPGHGFGPDIDGAIGIRYWFD